MQRLPQNLAIDDKHSPNSADVVRKHLVAVAKDLFAHEAAGTVPVTDEVVEIPATRYTDPEYFEREKRLVFGRVPIIVAATCEIKNPGDRVALDIAGISVLVVRGRDGAARAFLNACSHRGAILAEGSGSSARIKDGFHFDELYEHTYPMVEETGSHFVFPLKSHSSHPSHQRKSEMS